MNILPQKSWHVRRKENVEKVRRDEEEAEGRRLELEQRHLAAEAEALRTRLGGKANPLPPHQATSTIYDGEGHVNLFHDRDLDNSLRHKADHRETETKHQTQDWARKVGIIVGLSDKSEEKDSHWVFGNQSQQTPGASGKEKKMSMVEELATQKKEAKEQKRKAIDDPMAFFSSSSKKQSAQAPDPNKYSLESAYNALSASKTPEIEEKNKKKSKKEKKKKKKKRHRQRSQSHSGSSDEDERKSKKLAKLEVMRKERLEREKQARKTAQDILNGGKKVEEGFQGMYKAS